MCHGPLSWLRCSLEDLPHLVHFYIWILNITPPVSDNLWEQALFWICFWFLIIYNIRAKSTVAPLKRTDIFHSQNEASGDRWRLPKWKNIQSINKITKKKENAAICCLQKYNFTCNFRHHYRIRGWKTETQANENLSFKQELLFDYLTKQTSN